MLLSNGKITWVCAFGLLIEPTSSLHFNHLLFYDISIYLLFLLFKIILLVL